EGKDASNNSATPAWDSAIGNIAVTEMYQVAIDASGGNATLLAAAQDNGTSYQYNGGWREAIGGDGTVVLFDSVNDERYFVDEGFFLGSGPTGSNTPTATINNATNLTLNSRAETTQIKTIEALPFKTAAALNPDG